jgi:hypothetical protein
LDNGDPLAREPASLLQGRGEGSGAGALGGVVRVAEQDADRAAHFTGRLGDCRRLYFTFLPGRIMHAVVFSPS